MGGVHRGAAGGQGPLVILQRKHEQFDQLPADRCPQLLGLVLDAAGNQLQHVGEQAAALGRVELQPIGRPG
jgi:hypothetical protein